MFTEDVGFNKVWSEEFLKIRNINSIFNFVPLSRAPPFSCCLSMFVFSSLIETANFLTPLPLPRKTSSVNRPQYFSQWWLGAFHKGRLTEGGGQKFEVCMEE
jgi:hypothetical protein